MDCSPEEIEAVGGVLNAYTSREQTAFHARVLKEDVPLALDMIEVGESTGALPAMLTSVAEFYEEDVSTRVTGLLSLIEPVIMLVMAVFVGFVLVSLYLPIFSLADSIRP